MTDDAALVLVLAGDTIEALIAKVRATGNRRIQLFVPAGSAALEAPGALHQLRAATGVSELLVFSTSRGVLAAAQRSGAVAFRLDDGQHSENGGPPGAAAVLSALDELPSAKAGGPPPSAADALADLDALAASIGGTNGRRSRSGETTTQRRRREEPLPPPRGNSTTERRRREEPLPPPRGNSTTERRRREEPLPPPRGNSTTEQRREQQEPPAAQWWTSRVGLLTLLALVLALALGAWWVARQRVQVTIAPPPSPTETTPVERIPVALSEVPVGAAPGTVQARQLGFDAQVSLSGQATARTSAPVSSAKGTVSVFNTGNAFTVAAGTEVSIARSDGSRVSFSTDQDVLVPGRTTSNPGPGQTLITDGQASLPITARAPGSASNIPEGGTATIAGLGLSGQAGSISGGEEQEVIVVGQDDVNALLGRALADLYNAGISGLQAQGGAGWALERGTITPSPEALANEGRYEIVEVVPPIGSQLTDAANPAFTLVVRSRLSALATPTERPLESQIGEAVRAGLAADGRLPVAAEATIDGWTWDGQELRANATIVLRRDPTGLPVGFVGQLQRDLVGKSTAEAQELLETYKSQGQIGAYSLPAQERLPNWSFLLTVAVAAAEGNPS